MRSATSVAAVLFAILGALMVYGGLRLGLASTYGPGPGFMPVLTGASLAVTSLLLLVRMRFETGPDRTWLPPGPGLRQTLIVLTATVGAITLFHLFGMLISLGLFLVVLLRLIGRHSWRMVAGVAVGTPIVLHLLFERWLAVQLPTGILGI